MSGALFRFRQASAIAKVRDILLPEGKIAEERLE
jgi:hypothetical protein